LGYVVRDGNLAFSTKIGRFRKKVNDVDSSKIRGFGHHRA